MLVVALLVANSARLIINDIEIIYRFVSKIKFQLNAISEQPTYIKITITEGEKDGNKISRNKKH